MRNEPIYACQANKMDAIWEEMPEVEKGMGHDADVRRFVTGCLDLFMMQCREWANGRGKGTRPVYLMIQVEVDNGRS